MDTCGQRPDFQLFIECAFSCPFLLCFIVTQLMPCDIIYQSSVSWFGKRQGKISFAILLHVLNVLSILDQFLLFTLFVQCEPALEQDDMSWVEDTRRLRINFDRNDSSDGNFTDSFRTNTSNIEDIDITNTRRNGICQVCTFIFYYTIIYSFPFPALHRLD